MSSLHDGMSLVAKEFAAARDLPRALRLLGAFVRPTPGRALERDLRSHLRDAQQIVEAFPEDTAPRYLLRDDAVYRAAFGRRIAGLGIEEVKTAPHSRWQNPFAERLVGSIRRECLDHVIVLGEGHPRAILKSYLAC